MRCDWCSLAKINHVMSVQSSPWKKNERFFVCTIKVVFFLTAEGFKVCKRSEPNPNESFVDAANADYQILKDGEFGLFATACRLLKKA